jgi:NTP pyrophosphatase (non-canonical NTP hydrolase)
MDSETYDVITDMEADEYQSEALKTAMCPVIGHPIIYPLLGIVGEMGEVLDKIHFYNAPGHTPPWQGSSRGDITKELGDVLWYSSVLADRLGYKLSEVIGFKFLNAYQKSLGITRPLDDRIGLLPAAENQFVSAVGKLSERVKKVFRDNDATFDDGCKTDLMKLLAEVLATLAILSKTLNIEFSVVGRINIDKLLSRRARNKIQGDGDDR